MDGCGYTDLLSFPGHHRLTTSEDFASGLANYVFNTGFCGQQWADVQLLFFNTSVKLHRRECAALGFEGHPADLSHPRPFSVPGSPAHELLAGLDSAASVHGREHHPGGKLLWH